MTEHCVSAAGALTGGMPERGGTAGEGTGGTVCAGSLFVVR